MTTLTLPAPDDYDLARDVCSYGYFVLAPHRWSVGDQTLTTTLDLSAGREYLASTCVIGETPSGKIRARFDTPLTRPQQAAARAQLRRMLRLDEPPEAIAAFHRADPRWKKSGRGRLFRSPTLFEDVCKTVTSCNVAWPSTVKMNTRLCAVLGRRSASGDRAFPTAAKVARTRAGTLRARCGVGYRDQRLIDLASRFASGDIDEAWLADPAAADGDVFAFLKSLPGIGPYAAGNIMQLLGRYSRLALDTESVRHGKAVLGYTGSDAAILKHLAAHYEPFGAHKFRSYWFELWAYYESKRGPAHLWSRETIPTFTAAQLDRAPMQRAGRGAAAAGRQTRGTREP